MEKSSITTPKLKKRLVKLGEAPVEVEGELSRHGRFSLFLLLLELTWHDGFWAGKYGEKPRHD